MKSKNYDSAWIVHLSTFPPRECGIATFTWDLVHAFNELFSPREESKVIALNNNGTKKAQYSREVIMQISQEKKDDYMKAAKKLNGLSQVKIVCIQHEFGIHGGEHGSNILYFLQEIKKPVVVTLHTVVPSSSPFYEGHRPIVRAIGDYSRFMVVMTETSRKLLISDYNINPDKVRVIPHGIHGHPYQEVKQAKKELGMDDQVVVSTFGLLNRGKGIEYALEALPEIIKKFPQVVYYIMGVTHPVILKKEGDIYRDELKKRVGELRLDQHVVFHNKYFSTPDILQFLRATDIYLSLSLNSDQAVSGTLSYALGCGRPVISTAFAQAKEDVTDEIGRLVEFRNPHAIAIAAIELLENEPLRIEMGKKAFFRTRRMVWRNVALSYMREFLLIAPELRIQEKNLPKIRLTHIRNMTDEFGMFQFARLTDPDPSSGYTLDDNARALIICTEYHKKYRGKISLKLADIYLEFVCYAFNRSGYNNYVNHDKTFNAQRNTAEDLNDAYARGIYSLAVAMNAKHMPLSLRQKAARVFKKKFNPEKKMNAPRTAAFYIKALSECVKHTYDKGYEDSLKNYCEYLVGLYEKNSESQWQWFEDRMSYSNGVMPEALFLAYKITGNQKYFNVAKSTLDFLVYNSMSGSLCVPVGQNGWFKKGQKKNIFDQQPEEVSALVLALKAAYETTKDTQYQELLYNVFYWFLGNNVLGQVVYDHMSGGCYDGVGEREVNLNQGAESTLSYLGARLAL